MAAGVLGAIDAHFLDTAGYTGLHACSAEVRAALAAVDRADFVAEDQRSLAGLDSPLPIGCGQTISQPFIVALMTELLRPGPQDRVLEIGTGCGYQSAILAQLVKQVYSIEIIPELAETSRQRLSRLGYDNIKLRNDDGCRGWPEQAPFDGIVVTAAMPVVPDCLLEQLAPGGRLVVPVGGVMETQQLMLFEQVAEDWNSRPVLPVRFVPFTGRLGK
jgi:protein-L-isoaspartate(D-aspartate) O-methyltransferase